MEASESIYVASPKIKDPEVGFQSFDSPNPDLDHARSDTGNTAEELTAKFQQLVLKEQWEPAPKDEDEKDGNWGLKEAEDGQEAEKGLGGSHWEEVKAGESEWNGWGDNGNDNGVVIDVVVVEEGSEAEDGSERYGGTDTKRYQYQYPVRPEAEDCAFYLKTGTCKFGSTCRFNHPVRRKNQAVKEKVKEKEEPTERLGQTACKGEKECPFYMRTGSCKYGANCRFNHPDPTAVGGSDNPSGYGNGGSATLDASQSSIASWSSSRKFNETAPFAPIVLSPSHGVPSQNPEWNGLQDQNICAHYSRYGICKFGPACKFDHPLHRASSAMTGVDQHLPYGDSVTTDKAVGGGIGSEATFRQSQ